LHLTGGRSPEYPLIDVMPSALLCTAVVGCAHQVQNFDYLNRFRAGPACDGFNEQIFGADKQVFGLGQSD
jgi:hypothetical protein